MSRSLSPKLGALCATATLVVVCGTALGYFSAGGTGTAAAGVTQLTAPTITAATPASGGTVSLTWKAVSAPNGGTATYYVNRNGAAAGGNCPAAAEPTAVTTCTDSGLEPGTYEYTVTAVFSTWTKKSAVTTAKVTVGPVSKFAIAGSTTSPSTGAGVNLTITAKDAAGATVTTFTGSHSLTFAGASNSPEGKSPTVVNAAGTAVAFGTATALTFTNGVAAAASSKNGFLQIYKAGEANVTATEGSLTTPVPLALNVLPTATRFTLAAASATPTAGAGDNLTISASDAYGNASTNYTGSHNLVFSGTGTGAETSPSGKAPTVANSSATAVAFGTATAINFSAGVATVSAGANGEMTLYKSGAAAIKATEGSVTTPTALSVTVGSASAASLNLTASTTTPATTTSISLTETAKDAYGNTATSYSGSKTLTFTAAGAPSEPSPAGNTASITNSSGTAVAFETAIPITFTSGVATVAATKAGAVRLYKPGSATITATDGAFTTPALALTVSASAKRVAFSGLTASPGTVSTTCLFTCSVTTLGNSGTITSKLAITDEYGNIVSNVGAGKTATLSVTAGSPAGTISGSPLSFPETGAAISTTAFTYTSPATGSYTTNTITAASTGFTSATVTAAK
ncbi:MAG: fibronectin type III domain-containing protein [Solirubrobacterales bacterium]|nr:fibronectin type III domain-containing protein [Solirubrobacterales bacterium]